MKSRLVVCGVVVVGRVWCGCSCGGQGDCRLTSRGWCEYGGVPQCVEACRNVWRRAAMCGGVPQCVASSRVMPLSAMACMMLDSESSECDTHDQGSASS